MKCKRRSWHSQYVHMHCMSCSYTQRTQSLVRLEIGIRRTKAEPHETKRPAHTVVRSRVCVYVRECETETKCKRNTINYIIRCLHSPRNGRIVHRRSSGAAQNPGVLTTDHQAHSFILSFPFLQPKWKQIRNAINISRSFHSLSFYGFLSALCVCLSEQNKKPFFIECVCPHFRVVKNGSVNLVCFCARQ